jgi:type IV secretory pathway VirB10-like protein
MMGAASGKGSRKAVDAFALEAGVPSIDGELKAKPRYVDRISKRVIWVGLGVVALMVGIFIAALNAMDARKQGKVDTGLSAPAPDTAPQAAEQGAPKELLSAGVGDSGPVGGTTLPGAAAGPQSLVAGSGTLSASEPLKVPGPDAGAIGSAGGPARQGGLPPGSGLDAGTHTMDSSAPKPPTPEQQLADQAKLDRAKRLSQARSSGLSSKPFSAGGGGEGAAPAGVLPAGADQLLARLQGSAANSAPAMQAAGAKADSEQEEKRAFLRSAGKDDQRYLPGSPLPARSPNELRRGSFIPLRLEGAINSGLPGMIKARVTEDVYDTVTGCRLLVPAMTSVQGHYDSKVAVGQTRNLVVWTYMGFADGSDLDLGAMQGYDRYGAAGVEADVDNHYTRLFGLTFGMSMITAGVQQSMPDTSSSSNSGQTPEQALATAMAQQYGQLGAQLLGKYMQVQPTLRNYPGERFMIMLPSSIIFTKVWRDRCGVQSKERRAGA